CRSVIRRCAHVDETYANRSAIYSPVLDCSGRAVRARPNPVIYRLVSELEVVAAHHVGPIMRQLRLELWLVARGRPQGERRTGGHAGVERKGGWIRSGVGLRRETAVDREPRDDHVEERSVRDPSLPLAFVHTRITVLVVHRFGRGERRDAATRLLFLPLLEISNEGVCRRRPPGSLDRMVVEDPQIGAEVARNARHHLVDREMVERIEEPEAIL